MNIKQKFYGYQPFKTNHKLQSQTICDGDDRKMMKT